METMMVATCTKCRAWYNLDFEESMPDWHFDMRTGEACYNDGTGGDLWHIIEVPYRVEWSMAN